MIYVVGMAPLMMHHAYTNFGGGGSNIQQMQGPPQQLHLQQHQLQQQWNHTAQKRSKYYYQINQKISRILSPALQKSPFVRLIIS